MCLKLRLKSANRNTIWRVDVRILNNPEIFKEIKGEIKQYLEENDDDDKLGPKATKLLAINNIDNTTLSTSTQI